MRGSRKATPASACAPSQRLRVDHHTACGMQAKGVLAQEQRHEMSASCTQCQAAFTTILWQRGNIKKALRVAAT